MFCKMAQVTIPYINLNFITSILNRATSIFVGGKRVARNKTTPFSVSPLSTGENKLVISRCAHYLRAVTVVEDYTSITRSNFKASPCLLSFSLALPRLSLALASQPFVGYSMVLQSVTRAVTQPMGRLEGVASFRKADYSSTRASFWFSPSVKRVLFLFPSFSLSLFFSRYRTRRLPFLAWSMSSGSNRSRSFLPTIAPSSLVHRSSWHRFARFLTCRCDFCSSLFT